MKKIGRSKCSNPIATRASTTTIITMANAMTRTVTIDPTMTTEATTQAVKITRGS